MNKETLHINTGFDGNEGEHILSLLSSISTEANNARELCDDALLTAENRDAVICAIQCVAQKIGYMADVSLGLANNSPRVGHAKDWFRDKNVSSYLLHKGSDIPDEN